VNEEPLGKGWFYKMRVADPAELDGLLDEAAYAAFLKSLA
jgi:glycine cleavage system H protein